MSALVTLCCLLGASTFDETFVDANGAYRAGLFPEAAQAYEHLVASSVADPVVFYNLGNAYYRNGQLAEAIANYERALALDPTLNVARENLGEALRGTERGLAPPRSSAWEEALLFWHDGLAPGLTRGLAFVTWLLFWAALGLRLWRPYPFSRTAAGALLALSLLFGLSLWSKAHPPLIAVAAETRVPVRFGTNPNETVRFELFEGDRVAIEERRTVNSGPEAGKRWARVITAGGERGWVPETHLAFVGPPYEAGVIEEAPQ